jgi:protein TonB
MKAGINWQTDTGSLANASTTTSDAVPKETGDSISYSTASLSPAAEIKVISSTQPAGPTMQAPKATVNPSPQTPPQPPAQATPTSSSNSAQPTQTQAKQPSQAQTTQNSPQPTQISGGVLNGKALSLPKPDYPATARASGASGIVVVEVTVDEKGKVIAARAVSGHPMLRASAVLAARLARFAPTKLSGEPVKVTGTISYNFIVR